MLKKIKIFFLILINLFGCRKNSFNYKIYKIYKGHHRSSFSYKTTKSNLINFDVIFDKSAIYKVKNSNNQADINKLYGVSDCGRQHMEYSIRFGWRYYQNRLQLLWFKHEAGIFSFGLIKNIKINKSYNCTIKITDNNYILCVDNTCESITRICSKNYMRYVLYPYFGGDEKAPHDITIKIKNN